MKKLPNELKLLPPVFRLIGFGLLAICILSFLLLVTKAIVIDKEKIKPVLELFFHASLLLLITSRKKSEDEESRRIRINSMAVAFLFGAVGLIVYPLTNLVFDGSLEIEESVSEYVGFLLIFYFIAFYVQRMYKPGKVKD